MTIREGMLLGSMGLSHAIYKGIGRARGDNEHRRQTDGWSLQEKEEELVKFARLPAWSDGLIW